MGLLVAEGTWRDPLELKALLKRPAAALTGSSALLHGGCHGECRDPSTTMRPPEGSGAGIHCKRSWCFPAITSLPKARISSGAATPHISRAIQSRKASSTARFFLLPHFKVVLSCWQL